MLDLQLGPTAVSPTVKLDGSRLKCSRLGYVNCRNQCQQMLTQIPPLAVFFICDEAYFHLSRAINKLKFLYWAENNLKLLTYMYKNARFSKLTRCGILYRNPESCVLRREVWPWTSILNVMFQCLSIFTAEEEEVDVSYGSSRMGLQCTKPEILKLMRAE